MKKFTLLSLALTLSIFAATSRLVVAAESALASPTMEVAQDAVDQSELNTTSDDNSDSTTSDTVPSDDSSDSTTSDTAPSNQNTDHSLATDNSSRQNSRINYSVPGEVPVIAQPTNMTCWAAAATMMVSWHDQISYTIEAVMDRAGQVYRQKFNKNESLFAAEENQLFTTLGLKKEAPQNYSPEGLLSLLQNYGPIFVIGNEGSTDRSALHVRIITGMSGDGTPDGTQLQINDPDGGRSYTESLSNFAQKYEDVANVDTNGGFELRIQVAHF